MERVAFDHIKGKTLVRTELNEDETELRFFCADGSEYMMYHAQDCCESVWLEDVVGDLDDILGEPILVADESMSNDDYLEDFGDESWTWTFYTLRTMRGTVTLR